MKKAKVMLSALAVVAIVGGALAAKAKSTGFIVYTYDDVQKACVQLDHKWTFGGSNVQRVFTTDVALETPPPTESCQDQEAILQIEN